jgi:surfactin synthase thioesterase subunit
MSAASSNWFVRLRARPDARVRLVCFPSAGAGASVYGRWSEHLPPDVEVWAAQLPGRETRRLERSLTDLHEIADRCAALIEPVLDRPFGFFGHSMGALVAFEVARRLRARDRVPMALFVSGRAAPHVARGYAGIADLSDDDFITKMDTMFGGVPELLKTDAEFRELYLPPLRADVEAVAAYRPVDDAPQPFPMYVLGGAEDRSVPREALDAWEGYAGGTFAVHTFPGDHFYVYSTREPVIEFVARTMALAGARNDPAGAAQ